MGNILKKKITENLSDEILKVNAFHYEINETPSIKKKISKYIYQPNP